MLSPTDRFLKRAFDITAAVVGLVFGGWLIVLAYLVASVDTGKSGFFRQQRIGRDGKPFRVVKIRSMRDIPGYVTSVTTGEDPRITTVGKLLRKSKVDELPQLWNVLVGEMSMVGPRPEVPGYADQLEGDDRLVLSIRPGVTGPATLKYRREEELLSRQKNPDQYNDEVLYPDKVRINKHYVEHYSFWMDLYYIWDTIAGRGPSPEEIEAGSTDHEVRERAA